MDESFTNDSAFFTVNVIFDRHLNATIIYEYIVTTLGQRSCKLRLGI